MLGNLIERLDRLQLRKNGSDLLLDSDDGRRIRLGAQEINGHIQLAASRRAGEEVVARDRGRHFQDIHNAKFQRPDQFQSPDQRKKVTSATGGSGCTFQNWHCGGSDQANGDPSQRSRYIILARKSRLLSRSTPSDKLK